MKPFAVRTQATAVGGRLSAVASADGSLKVRLAPRHGRDREEAFGANAEQLMASALAASFLEELKGAAAHDGVALAADANVTATVSLDADGEVPVFSAHVDVDLPGLDRATCVGLVQRARKACPYAHLLPGHFDVQVSVL